MSPKLQCALLLHTSSHGRASIKVETFWTHKIRCICLFFFLIQLCHHTVLVECLHCSISPAFQPPLIYREIAYCALLSIASPVLTVNIRQYRHNEVPFLIHLMSHRKIIHLNQKCPKHCLTHSDSLTLGNVVNVTFIIALLMLLSNIITIPILCQFSYCCTNTPYFQNQVVHFKHN